MVDIPDADASILGSGSDGLTPRVPLDRAAFFLHSSSYRNRKEKHNVRRFNDVEHKQGQDGEWSESAGT